MRVCRTGNVSVSGACCSSGSSGVSVIAPVWGQGVRSVSPSSSVLVRSFPGVLVVNFRGPGSGFHFYVSLMV